MTNILEYKGYIGSIEYSPEDQLICGSLQGISDLVCYHGKNIAEFIADFHLAVDDYLAVCEGEGIEPAKTCLDLKDNDLPINMYQVANIYALSKQMTLSSFIDSCVSERLKALNVAY